MAQYEDLCERIIREGKWVTNTRTGKRCLTIINADFVYDVAAGEFPLVTTRKGFYKTAIMELIGYLRGYDNAAQFRAIGCKTWDSNANETPAWLQNPARKGPDDCGYIYGKVARNFPKPDGGSINLIRKVYEDLLAGRDDRGEIITFYHPGLFHLASLRPCMYEHQFSILGGELYLNSTQRSTDVPLGLVANQVQCYTLLALMAQITGLKPAKAFHRCVNVHIYEDQLELMRDVQLKRAPYPSPGLWINPEIRTLSDIETWVGKSDFEVMNYQHHDAIAYPFSP